MQVSLADIKVNASSYVDPQGFVFEHDHQIYRCIYADAAPLFQELLDDQYIAALADKQKVVRSQVADFSIKEHPGALVLQHEKVSPLNFCNEWPHLMLQRAALHTVSLSVELAERDLMLQDAYPWNLIFQGTKPVFVDLTSIIKQDDRNIWPAYSQFKQFFLWPLILGHLGRGRFARALLENNIDGVTLSDFYNIAPLQYKLTHPGLVLEKYLNSIIQPGSKLYEFLVKQQREKPVARPSKSSILLFHKMLQSKISKLKPGKPQDPWANYYSELPNAIEPKQKTDKIRELVSSIKPDSVLDVGCNTGVFSIIAAESGARRVISVDSSESCIDSLFEYADANSLPITPLVVNILCPTPAYGFLGTQYDAFPQRAKSDLVMALGVMHHLHIAGRQSIGRIAGLMNELSNRHLIFEYVAKNDANNEFFSPNRTIDYSLDEIRTNLGRYFGSIEIHESDRPTRKLLLCSK